MRKILFRGKRTYNGEWIEGDLLNTGDTPVKICWQTHNVRTSLEVDPETVGQYIGIVDCNGKKIFEGDIITIDGYDPVVVYYKERQALFAFKMDDHTFTFDSIQGAKLTVIGNIYDNSKFSNQRRIR